MIAPTRRGILAGGLAAAVGRRIGAQADEARSRDAASESRALVLVELAGGNDGLNTLIPTGDDAYYRARPKLAIAASDALRVDDRRGMHPRLVRLHKHFSEGRLTWIDGVGYPNPNRSHFKSRDIWHTADMGGRDRDEGWVGRLLEALHGPFGHPNRSVHVGSSVPYSLQSSVHAAACFTEAKRYRWMSSSERIERLSKGSAGATGDESSIDFIRRVMADARTSSDAVREAALSYKARVEYPEGELGDALWTSAALVSADIGCRVISVKLSGFDTHNGQRNRHDRLMRELDAGLGAFLDDIAGTPAGGRTVVLAFSEFGRRVAENGSEGTDHGTAGPVLFAGEGVRGGVLGAPPSLTDLDDGDLMYTTDFRSVYGGVIADWFGADPISVVGGDVEALDLLG